MNGYTLAIQLIYLVFFHVVLTDDIHADLPRQKIFLNSLFRHSSYPSIEFALEQIKTIPMDIELTFDTHRGDIPCDVGSTAKKFFDIINRTTSWSVLMSDTCQNVLSYIAEAVTYFQLPVFSFIDSDLSLSSLDRYPYFYHLVPSDHAHNLVRKQLLQYFNWTRFGVIYQHGPKYTLVANDLSNLTATDRKQWEVNLTRGIAYRHGQLWSENNAKNMKGLLRDFKNKDVRIILANFNQTIARHMFCQITRENVYGSRYQWILLGYPSLTAWWTEPTDCTMQELIRAMNGTIQTRIPRLSIDETEDRPNHVLDYFERFAELERNYFDAYAYDTIWSLAYLYQSRYLFNQSNIKHIVEHLDYIGATGRVRYLNGGRIGEILVEQYVACRMMYDGSCQIPCYEEENNCNLTIVKIFLAKNLDDKNQPPMLIKLNSIMWHGNGPPLDRTKRMVEFVHISPAMFRSMSICSAVGLIIAISLFVFNLHFRKHRYIRMSSSTLNNLILAGCMLAYISIIFMGADSSLFPQKSFTDILMNIICATRIWLLCLSFTLAFGSMFSKTWRVHSIFNNIYLIKKGIHDSKLLAVVGMLLCIDCFFLIIWQVFDPIHRKLVSDTSYRPEANPDLEIHPYREECKSEYTTYWFLLLVVYKGLLMFYGSFLSWTTRHVTIPALNDSRYIGLSVYIVLICSILGSLVALIPSQQIQLWYFLISLFILICTTATVCLVFVPKIIEVYRDPYSKKKQPRMMGRVFVNSIPRTVLTVKHMNNAIIDNQQLHLVLAMQEQTLDRLTEQLHQCLANVENHSAPLEFERLMVPEEDETSIDDEEQEEDDEVDSLDQIILRASEPFQGRVARAVSLCLYNKIQMAQIHWPETLGVTRRSTFHSENCGAPSSINQTEQTLEEEQEEITTKLLQSNYDGLDVLDEDIYNQFRQEIHDFEIDPTKHCLIKEIDQWERDSIDRIQQIAKRCKIKWIHYSNRFHQSIKNQLDRLAKQINDIQREKELNEVILNDLKENLEILQKQFIQPTNISIKKQSTSFINRISLLRLTEKNTRWKQFATTIAGGNGRGCRLNQLNDPEGICVDDENHVIYIADYHNHRIVEWTFDGNHARIVAGGHGQGNQFDQLNSPLYLFVDDDHSLYISDCDNHRVMKWIRDANEGRVVAGGNGKGDQLTQLSNPQGVIVDRTGQIYVADFNNHRVMRWCEGEKQGTIVIGEKGCGNGKNQLNYPAGLSFDEEGNLYVVDWGNDRIEKFEIEENNLI